MAGEAFKDSPLADIMNFLELPYPVTEDQSAKVFTIRVWLEATNPQAEVLEIKRVADLDRIEYQAISSNEIKLKERCLYRDPVGSNVSWRFSPLYKLGRGSKDPHKELVGESGIWQENDKTRFYKLYNNLLADYERSGYFTEGSAANIMSGLVERIEKIIELWSNERHPSFLIFGLKVDGKFLYPGEVTAFVNYFKNKLNPAWGKKKAQQKLLCFMW